MMKQKLLNRLALAIAAIAAATFAVSAPALASESDDRIESSFKDSYVNRTYLKNDDVKTESKDGAVTLTGSVSQESHRTLAGETASGMPGVVSVDNQLKTTAEIDADNTDARIDRRVRIALLFHRNVSASKTTVSVKDGIVSLTGEASSLAQKDLTTEYAKDIEDVIDVINEMTVSADQELVERTEGEKIDDASVTAQVKAAMSTHRSTSAIKIAVTTRDGEVTLTGVAKNDAEKSLVTKLATDIQGVTTVKNNMTIDAIKTI